MKKAILIAGLILYAATASSQVYWREDKFFSINASYAHSNIDAGVFNQACVELTCFPSDVMGWEFSSEIRYSKGFWSFEPAGFLGTLMTIYTQTHAEFGSEAKLLSILLAISSAKLPIYPLEIVEFTPYWSLLKFVKFQENPLQICGHVGIKIKLFPFVHSDNYDLHTFYLAPFIEHDFGWQLKEGTVIPLYPSVDKYSPFKGTVYGFQLGFYF